MNENDKKYIITKTKGKRIGNALLAVVNFGNTRLADNSGTKVKGVLVRIEDDVLFAIAKYPRSREYEWIRFDNLSEELKEEIVKYFRNKLV